MIRDKDLSLLIDVYLRGTPRQGCFSANQTCADEFEQMKDLEGAISTATLSVTKQGKRHPHQRRLPASVLTEVKDRLLEKIKDVESCRNFDQLHGLVSGICRDVHGAGPLLAYDVSSRIAFGFRTVLPPVLVYLHAGAAKGAGKLGVSGPKAKLEDFPEPIRRLDAAQAEDFLCVFKDKF